MKRLLNITIAEFRDDLNALGAEFVRTKGGHEIRKRVSIYSRDPYKIFQLLLHCDN